MPCGICRVLRWLDWRTAKVRSSTTSVLTRALGVHGWNWRVRVCGQPRLRSCRWTLTALRTYTTVQGSVPASRCGDVRLIDDAVCDLSGDLHQLTVHRFAGCGVLTEHCFDRENLRWEVASHTARRQHYPRIRADLRRQASTPYWLVTAFWGVGGQSLPTLE